MSKLHHRFTLITLLCAGLGLFRVAPAVQAQALIPHTVAPDATQLEQTGKALLREAVQLAQFQQYGLALARTQLVTQLLPESDEAWALLGGLYLSTEKLEPGIQSLEKALSLNPENAGVHFSLGSAYFRQEKYDDSVRVIKEGLAIKPDVPEALFDLGNAYFQLGKYDSALDQYQKAVEQDEKFWPAVNNMGLIKYEQGEKDTAVQLWRDAIAIDEKATTEPKLALAVALYTQGQTEQALQLATSALQTDQRYGDVAFLKENLWGDRLISDTREVLKLPKVRDTLAVTGDAE